MEHTLGNDLIQTKLYQFLCSHHKSPAPDSMHQTDPFLHSKYLSHLVATDFLWDLNAHNPLVLPDLKSKWLQSLWHTTHHSPSQSKQIIPFSVKCWNRTCCFHSFTDRPYLWTHPECSLKPNWKTKYNSSMFSLSYFNHPQGRQGPNG